MSQMRVLLDVTVYIMSRLMWFDITTDCSHRFVLWLSWWGLLTHVLT